MESDLSGTSNQPQEKIVNCLNCQTEIPSGGVFCPACGQKTGPAPISLWNLITDFLSQQFSLEGRLVRTLQTLVFSPGKLTNEYWSGKRASYLSPVQLYLVTSLLFFFLIDSLSGIAPNSPFEVEPGDVAKELEKLDDATVTFTFGFRKIELTKEQALEFVRIDTDQLDRFFRKHQIPIDSFTLFLARVSHAVLRPGGANEFVTKYFRLFSQSVIVLMPVLGLILYGLYWRRTESSIKCILLSAHVQSFAYLVMILIALIAMFWDNDRLFAMMSMVVIVYFVWAQKTVFGGRWPAVLLKSFVASILYFCCTLVLVILLLPLVFLSM